MAEEQEADQLAKVQEYIRGEVNQYLQQTAANMPVQQPTMTPQQAAYNQVGQYINHFTQPGIQYAQHVAADAKDYSDFYARHPEAREYQDQIEQTFQVLAANNRPTVRDDCYRYVRGRELEADPQAFLTKERQRQERALERANYAGDMGAGSVGKEKADALFANFDQLSLEDMEKRLEGITF